LADQVYATPHERFSLKQAASDIPDMVDTQSFISWVAALQSAIQEQANNK
jgi:hypothetical protein